MERVGCVVVGAGVVGLAVARSLARAGREVVVLERERLIGSHTSARNSEVIHAGIYYPRDSMKARLCVRGREMLYAWCADHGVPHRRLGKIIVATSPGQEGALARIAAAAAANGVDDLRALGTGELREMEPALRGVAGLLSPSTGIVDSHALMLSYQGELEDAGGAVALATGFLSARPEGEGFVVEARSGTGAGSGERVTLGCDLLVNAAGLFAGEVAGAIAGLAAPFAREVFYCKGNYFGMSGKVPFSHLIYPVPERDGLGTHLTLDLAGRGRFGPDTEWIDGIDYALDPRRGDGFYAAIRTYWPGLPDGALTPDYTGIRPKLAPAGGRATDFTIEGPESHGLPGLVNLFGIESPGLTASLAIAEEVLGRVGIAMPA